MKRFRSFQKKLNIFEWCNWKYKHKISQKLPINYMALILAKHPTGLSWLSPSSKICFICFNESPLKMIRNAFYFIFKFLSWLFSQKNRPDWKDKADFKFMTLRPGKQTITRHILPDISWSKNSQAMKYTQIIKYDKRNIFLQKSCRK